MHFGIIRMQVVNKYEQIRHIVWKQITGELRISVGNTNNR